MGKKTMFFWGIILLVGMVFCFTDRKGMVDSSVEMNARSAYVEKDVYVKKNKTFERVVVRDVGNVEIMLALGLGDRIVMACLDTQEVDYLKKTIPR